MSWVLNLQHTKSFVRPGDESGERVLEVTWGLLAKFISLSYQYTIYVKGDIIDTLSRKGSSDSQIAQAP